MRASILAGAMAAAAVAIAVVLLFVTMAHAHQTMGHFKYGQFLYGHKIGDPAAGEINCCRFGGDGDCQEYPAEKVKLVNGGYLLDDGEFIPASEVSVSPQNNDGEYSFWRCRHPNQPSHCFHAPPNGS